MENFAIDLDKVLDDFELNEDGHENESHTDKLQLDFTRENIGAGMGSNAAQVPAGLGAAGGWSEVLHEIPTEIRGPPDGQHDDEVLAPISENLLPHSSQECLPESLNSNSVNNEKGKVEGNSQHVPQSASKPDVTSEVSSNQEMLWPGVSSQSRVINDPPPPPPVDISIADPSSILEVPKDLKSAPNPNPSVINFEDKGACSLLLNQSLPPCPLDVIPVDVPSSVGSMVTHEGQHPDILDMRQNSHDELLHGFGNYAELPKPLEHRDHDSLPANEQLGNNSPDIQREAFLLPDLMPPSDIDRSGMAQNLPHLPEVSNPAVVTENSLSGSSQNTNEPAIVQESQSNSRIPEVANVHQSTEQAACWFEKSTAADAKDTNFASQLFSNHGSSSFSNACDNSNADGSSSDFHMPDQVSSSRFLPDISASCNNSNIPPADLNHLSESSNITPAIRFNPCSNVDEEELDAELQELEEEQARLQGAYSNSGFEAQEEPEHISPEVIEINNSSQSPDIIGGIDAGLGLPSNDDENLSSLQDLRSCPTINASIHEEPEINISPRVDFEIEPSVEVNSVEPEANHSSCISNPHQEDDLPSRNIDPNSPEEIATAVCENESAIKTDGIEEVLTESSATDTLSSTSTLTDGESLSPEHQTLPPLDQPQTQQSLPDSPSRETPGTLVTAVYDDNGSRGHSGSVGDNDRGLTGVGAVAPFWIPDVEAPNCQQCGVKFTVLKRRHHCRGCGRVLCSVCCHSKAALPYMEYKEARVCETCLHLLNEAPGREEEEVSARHSGRSPNPNKPEEYCSTQSPWHQVGAVGNRPPPTVMVPVGVLKRDCSNSGNGSSSRPRGNKQVIFSDGIRPGGDLTELGGQARPSSPFRKTGRSTRRVVPDYVFEPNPDSAKLEERMKGDGDPVAFALQKNLTVLVKQIKLDCCVGVEVWNVATRGLCNVGQEELVILLEVNPGEKSPPPHIFSFLHTVYQQANKGNLVTELGHTIFTEPEGFLGSKDHGGFLYIRPTYQCLHKLILPPAPYIFAVLIQKWETPWAKVFPLRLMLRLGAEFRYYPCPLVSTRNRKPVYCEIGHTIMNLLVDFRNYAYTIPVVQGFVIHMEDKKTTLLIPKNRYEQVWKALNNSNDHVLALGANFSPSSDSHLVTVEDDDGQYTTQAINIHNKPRKVTGASFIVFNGALKSNSGLKAKSSIVEDGLMVQIAGEMMTKLRECLRNMKDFDIPCGPATSTPDELVLVRWVQDDKNFNVGIKSPIDGQQMDGVPSVKIHSGTDYVSNDHLIRWTEVFIIQGETTTSTSDVNVSRLAESLALACCVALTPHLALLYDSGPNRLALRATIHQDNVGYEAGMGGAKLMPLCMNELDTELVPVIHRAAASITDQAIILELLFHIMEQ